MKLYRPVRVLGLIGALFVFPIKSVRTQNGTVSAQQSLSDKRDGQHDFDFLVGSWKFHLKRLNRRLAGPTEWVEFDGTTICQKVLDGRAEVEEMNVERADKVIHIHGLALRLYIRAIYARFVWSGVATNSPHFEQAFSTDGGKTWETNWITDQTKEKP